MFFKHSGIWVSCLTYFKSQSLAYNSILALKKPQAIRGVVDSFFLLLSLLLLSLLLLSLSLLLSLELAVFNFIIKFGYNARCHWLKERAL